MSLKVMLSLLGVVASTGLCRAEKPVDQAGLPAAKVVMKPVISTTTTSAGDPIALPRGHAQVTVSTYDIPPGVALPVHRHPFPRYGYVLEGTLEVTNMETGRAEVFKAGDFILEAVGHWHRGSNIDARATRLLVIDVTEAGADNTVLKQ